MSLTEAHFRLPSPATLHLKLPVVSCLQPKVRTEASEVAATSVWWPMDPSLVPFLHIPNPLGLQSNLYA